MGHSSTQARVTYSGRETSHLQLSLIWRIWPGVTSKETSARSSTTSTRLLTSCSLTCLREITRSVPSTGLHQRLSRILPAPFKEEVEALIEKKTITLDLY